MTFTTLIDTLVDDLNADLAFELADETTFPNEEIYGTVYSAGDFSSDFEW